MHSAHNTQHTQTRTLWIKYDIRESIYGDCLWLSFCLGHKFFVYINARVFHLKYKQEAAMANSKNDNENEVWKIIHSVLCSHTQMHSSTMMPRKMSTNLTTKKTTPKKTRKNPKAEMDVEDTMYTCKCTWLKWIGLLFWVKDTEKHWHMRKHLAYA